MRSINSPNTPPFDKQTPSQSLISQYNSLPFRSVHTFHTLNVSSLEYCLALMDRNQKDMMLTCDIEQGERFSSL